jgi:hypothetical protein
MILGVRIRWHTEATLEIRGRFGEFALEFHLSLY